MKHKLQSSIFLQPIDQHFFANKNMSFRENESDYFKSSENFKLDCLDNSTESDSGESKNENDFNSESLRSSLRKTSQIAEKSADEKNMKNCDSGKSEKFKFTKESVKCTNTNTNTNLTEQQLSEKNFHVPHFLLRDSDDEQSEEKYFSSSSSGSKGALGSESSGSTKRIFPFPCFKNKSFIELNNNFNNFGISNDICEYENINNKNNKSSFEIGNQNNLEIENLSKTRITDLLHCDWKSKINAQSFLKFNAYKKKVFDSLSGKAQGKKNTKNNKNNSSNNINSFKNNIPQSFSNLKNNRSGNYYFSQSSSNLAFNQSETKTINFNYMNNQNNNNNFLCNGKLKITNFNSNTSNNFNCNQKSNTQNSNLNWNQEPNYFNQINYPVQHPVDCSKHVADKAALFDKRPVRPLNSYSNSNINLRKSSDQNFNRTSIPNFPLKTNFPIGEVYCPALNSFQMDNQKNFSNYNDNNYSQLNTNNNFACNFSKSNLLVNYSNNFFQQQQQ